jgi:hypothetical protein
MTRVVGPPRSKVVSVEAHISRYEGGPAAQDDRDTELAQRAAGRISDYLTAHPGAGPVTFQGDLAGDDALVVPREAAVLLAKILGYLASGEGVEVIPDNAELTTQQAAWLPRRLPAVRDQTAGHRRHRVPAGRHPPADQVPGPNADEVPQ